jgi:tetratricopeptide (TPR) repeat protein
MTRSRILLFASSIWVVAVVTALKADPIDVRRAALSAGGSAEKSQIKMGFDLLYRLKFTEARSQFEEWQKSNPEDPLGYIWTAASYLFEEFYAQHVLTSSFFLDDNRLLGGIEGKPDEGRASNFIAANQKGRQLALNRLNADSGDADALFALSTSAGLQSDFESILEKRQMKSLSLIKEAEGYAHRLLALKPDLADAWFSLGAANYIIGSLPSYKRFFLWFGGLHGDKDAGMQQMKITADRGNYLKPFAQIFLALASMREKQNEEALSLLQDLVKHYPDNALFQTELARLENSTGSKHGGR